MTGKKWIPASAAAFGVALIFRFAGLAQAALVSAPCDAISGGGSLVNDQGGRVGLSAAVGCRGGALVGHVQYRDADNDIHFQSTAIAAWFVDPARPWERHACGIGRLKGSDDVVAFRVRLVDNGSPGRLDHAGITIENYRLQMREVRNPGGGNFTRHRDDGSVLPPADADFLCGDLLTP